ncbi:MAG TPA: hypothetical protein VE988_05430 [Gemmataceae bacterium]|nr:hypothetical protein [Gemmataceae bacterium]
MATATTTPVSTVPKSKGRGLYWLGIGACLLGIALMIGQYAMHVLIVPWYLPAFTTLGAVLLLLSWRQRTSITRIVTFGLITTLAAFQWFFFISLTQLPVYQGPAQAGKVIPAFTTTLASGGTFTDKTLQDGTPTVLVFFRGRW